MGLPWRDQNTMPEVQDADNLSGVVARLFDNFPESRRQEMARLPFMTKLLYLVDWKSAIDDRELVTGVDWHMDETGPSSTQVVNAFTSSSGPFLLKSHIPSKTRFDIEIVDERPDGIIVPLSAEHTRVVEHVIATTGQLEWNPLRRLIYSTFPMLSNVTEEEGPIDLVNLAVEYDKEKRAADCLAGLGEPVIWGEARFQFPEME